jgi:hypothetical protein
MTPPVTYGFLSLKRVIANRRYPCIRKIVGFRVCDVPIHTAHRDVTVGGNHFLSGSNTSH